MAGAQVANILNQGVPHETPKFVTVRAEAIQVRNFTKRHRRKELELGDSVRRRLRIEKWEGIVFGGLVASLRLRIEKLEGIMP